MWRARASRFEDAPTMEPTAPAAAPMTNTCAISSSTRDAPEPSPSHPRRGGENVATPRGFRTQRLVGSRGRSRANQCVFSLGSIERRLSEFQSQIYANSECFQNTRESKNDASDRGAHFAKRPRTTRPIARDGRHGRSVPGGRGLPAEDQHRWGVGVRATRESRRCVARIALEPILRPSATSRICPPSRDAPPSPND